MILTVTMNPSVDISYQLDGFEIDNINRIRNVSKTAGGKGLNVSRIISQLGGPVKATGVLGGTIGDFIIQQLNRSQIPNDFFHIEKESRNCIAILHDGLQTEILESGPTLTSEEGTAFLAKFEGLLNEVSMVTISGSLPNGLADDFYYQMLEICYQRKIPVILDSSGESLKQALLQEVKPFLIKPNKTELMQLLQTDFGSQAISFKQVLNHELFKGIEWVVVSLGNEGAFVKHRDDYYEVTIPKVNVVNPVGSGDAVVAGLAASLNANHSVEVVLKTAMTTGMLNAMEERTGYINRANFDEYFDLVQVQKVEEEQKC